MAFMGSAICVGEPDIEVNIRLWRDRCRFSLFDHIRYRRGYHHRGWRRRDSSRRSLNGLWFG